MALADTNATGTALTPTPVKEVLLESKPPSKIKNFLQGLQSFGWQGWLLVGVLLVLYAHVLRSLVLQWYNDADYSHGFLVPVLSAYLIWQRRDKLRLIPRQPAALYR